MNEGRFLSVVTFDRSNCNHKNHTKRFLTRNLKREYGVFLSSFELLPLKFRSLVFVSLMPAKFRLRIPNNQLRDYFLIYHFPRQEKSLLQYQSFSLLFTSFGLQPQIYVFPRPSGRK